MNKKNRRYLYLALIAGLVVLFYEMGQVNGQALIHELRDINFFWLAVAVLCMLCHWVIEAKIIQTMLKRQMSRFSFKNALRIPLIEHLFNSITPFSTGGQPAQLVALIKSGVDPGVSGSVCLMKFVTYQIMIVLNFLGCLVFGFKLISGELAHLSYLVLLGFVINVIVVLSLLMLMYCYPVTNWLVATGMELVKKVISVEKANKIEAKLLEKMTNFYAESHYMRKEKSVMVKTFVLTFLQLICYYIVPYFILLSLGVKTANALQVMIFHAFIVLIISLFPIPGGTGGAEYTFKLLFGGFLVVQTKLVLGIILWRLVTNYLGIFLGVIALGVQPDQSVKVKEREEKITLEKVSLN